MASRIIELFGYAPTDQSQKARQARANSECPFVASKCVKTLSNGDISGVCTLKPMTTGPVICCPYRLYADDYRILLDVAKVAFEGDVELFRGNEARAATVSPGKIKVAVFGKRWGKELRLPNRGKSGGYFVDWVLARLDDKGDLKDFVAIEVQSIDTTGNYQEERRAYLNNEEPTKASTAGFNWENVNKRILPQLIYKGHVLRRERLCRSGLFFVCPKPVNDKIRERLGGTLYEYQLQPGSLSLMWYDIGEEVPEGQIRELKAEGVFTTTVDQVANAFTSPSNLPNENVYRDAILAQL
ncbi:NotI family restriction endonuclease [Pseudomonas sp. SMV7]|uniref:NotI family restriction endonuclease n=1 Tax=Pseudomonas sp. SMV7 TaxID=3390194 RepID=UPI003F845ECA